MMNNFEYFNPTRIVFGQGTIARLEKLIPQESSILMCYGGGSIKQNGVYDQVLAALSEHTWVEFGGIEANPDYDTLLQAIHLGREHDADFVLAVGGGSVIDGAKLIAAGIPYQHGDVWQIVTGEAKVKLGQALPLGTVLTLPATASEMNGTSVISRRAIQEKLAWWSEAGYPLFSILDPLTTFTLPIKQVRNGVVDAYIHVVEQYATYSVGAELQDRQAEAILLTLQTVGEQALETPPDYAARANFMWAATNALNSLISRGVPSDWATHMIGHELTAFYGIDHAESLAVILPHLLWHQRERKAEKLVQYAQRVWGLPGDGEGAIRAGLDAMTAFFHSLGMPTTLTALQIDPDDAADRVSARFAERGSLLGEHQAITPALAAEIIRMSR